MTFGIERPLYERLAEREIPLVMVDAGPDRSGVSLLKVDYHHGIWQGVQHLAALGHRKLGFISGPAGLHSADSRLKAFRHSVAECGIPLEEDWIVTGDHTMEGGIGAMEKILSRPGRPTAVMCSNDMTALGVLHKAYRAGLRIPQDLSVIGFDDIHMARVMIPPLTSIQMSRLELARAAVSALRAHLDGGNAQREYKIDTRLVVRESTALPPGAMEDLRGKGIAHPQR
jgi:LacI family transcriptional regulator